MFFVFYVSHCDKSTQDKDDDDDDDDDDNDVHDDSNNDVVDDDDDDDDGHTEARSQTACGIIMICFLSHFWARSEVGGRCYQAMLPRATF